MSTEMIQLSILKLIGYIYPEPLSTWIPELLRLITLNLARITGVSPYDFAILIRILTDDWEQSIQYMFTIK